MVLICNLDLFSCPFDEQNFTLIRGPFHLGTGGHQAQGPALLRDAFCGGPMAFCLSSVPSVSPCQQKEGTSPGLHTFPLMMMDLFPGHWRPLSVPLARTASDGAGQPPADHVHHLFAEPGSLMPWWLHSLLLHCTDRRKCCPLHPRKEISGQALPHSSAWPEGAAEFGGESVRCREAELNGCPAATRASRVLRPRSSTLWAGGFC